MSLKLKFWGVRGSLPSSASPVQRVREIEHLMRGFFKLGHTTEAHIKDYLGSLSVPAIGGYGTATTCVEIKSEQTQIIIDGGSGIRNLGDQMMKTGQFHKPIHIFLTHFHWDHLIGLPFFTPNFVKGAMVNYYAVQPELEMMVRGKFKKPYFPVPYESLAANIKFIELNPRKTIEIEDIEITPYQLDHPDPCWGFKVQSGEKTYAHCVDTEGTRQTRQAMGPDLPLYQGVDLMYYDAQYTLPELAEKSNWGHSASQIGLDIAFREGIRNVIFAHHDPGATTKNIYELKIQTREYYDWKVKNAQNHGENLPVVKWRFAYEGLVVEI